MGGMTGSLLLLLWAGVSVSTVVDLQKRIFNGQNCKAYERLYHVTLIREQNGIEDFCGGSLISDKWILSAAHCWEQGWTIKAVQGHPGGVNVQNYVPINLNDIHKHGTADIMLLKLPTSKIGFHQIALPDCVKNPLPKNVMVQIAGHGSTIAASDKTRIRRPVQHLQCADIEAYSCPGVNQNPYDEMFCGKTTDINNPVGACFGDSGGGVVYDCKIYGVIRGGDPQKVCTAPDDFVGVCGHMTWIQNIMQNK